MNAEWGRRLRDAKRDYESEHDTRLSYRVIGERVAALVGREKPYTPTAVRAWFEDGQEPDAFSVAGAIATVLEADPGTLAFGPRDFGLADDPEHASSEEQRERRGRA